MTSTRTITRTPTATPPERGPRITFAGAISPDGCPFCCEFVCQGSPTPTPNIDAHGREVFVMHSGSLLFVVEGRSGPDGSLPGTNCGGTCPPMGTERGDIRLLVGTDLGDGSPEVCDMGPTVFGGVPGFDPPNLSNASQAVTEAIQDAACRFVPRDSGAIACTRDHLGSFSFLSCEQNCGAYRQYCFQVPLSAGFKVGDTVAQLQLRSVGGSLGPPKEIVVRVLP